jgi:hypothetical protein
LDEVFDGRCARSSPSREEEVEEAVEGRGMSEGRDEGLKGVYEMMDVERRAKGGRFHGRIRASI